MTNVVDVVWGDDEPELLAAAKPFEMPGRLSVQGTCNRCGYHGTV
jgi:hypothetical protein